MDPIEKAKVKNNTTRIVEILEPWAVVDLLYQERILSDEEYSRLNTISVREDRCRKLLDILCRGTRLPGKPSSYPVFLRALAKDYSFMAELIDETKVTEEQIADITSVQEPTAPLTQNTIYNFHGKHPIQIGHHNRMNIHEHGDQVSAHQENRKPVTVTDTEVCQTKPLPRSMRVWTCGQVYQWLCHNGVLKEHASALWREHVTGEVFEVITDDELKTNFNALPFGPRKSIIMKRDSYLKQYSTVNNKEETGTEATSSGYDEVDQSSGKHTDAATKGIGLVTQASANKNVDPNCAAGTSTARGTASQKSNPGNTQLSNSSRGTNQESCNQIETGTGRVHVVKPMQVTPSETLSTTYVTVTSGDTTTSLMDDVNRKIDEMKLEVTSKHDLAPC